MVTTNSYRGEIMRKANVVVLAILMAAVFVFSPTDALSAYQGQQLKGTVGYQLRKMDDKLDKVEKYLKFNAPPKSRYDSAVTYLEAADQAHKQILDYEMGKFDNQHPHYVTVVRRLEDLRAQVKALKQSMDGQSGQAATPAAAPKKADLAALKGQKLKGTVGYQLRKMDSYLDEAERALKADTSPESKLDAAKRSIEAADYEHKQILDYEMGKFNAQHPHYTGVVQRLEDLRAKVNAFGKTMASQQSSAPQPAGQNNKPWLKKKKNVWEGTGSSGLLVGMEVGLGRVSTAAGSVVKITERGVTAEYVKSGANYQGEGEQIKTRLKVAEQEWAETTKKYSGRFDKSNKYYRQVEGELNQARAAAEKFYKYHGLYGHKQSQAAAEALKPAWHYPSQGATSQVHQKNVGRIVWSKQIIQFRDQDQAKLENSFSLSDHIYGRVYFTDSIRNVPVFSKVDRRPQENTANSFEIKLFIDGKNTPISFGVFLQNRLGEPQAKKWTTLQFSPNPSKPDPGFEQQINQAWHKATRKLAPGSHQIRFEWWGTMGQLRTKNPLTVGEFTLNTAQGERMALAGKFPADVYTGSDLARLKEQMADSLVGPVTKNRAEIKRVAVISKWRHGVYRKTGKSYRMITGAILWADKDGDGVCKYTSYNFISDSLGGDSWTPVRFRSFCTSCPQAEIQCR